MLLLRGVKKIVQIIGIVVALLYSLGILWLYIKQPRTLEEIKTQAAVEASVYSIKQENFNEGLKQFNAEQYPAAIEQFKLADPAQQDAKTQFYIAYSYYMQGRGRFSDDDEMFKQGLVAVERCLAVAPNHIFEIDRADLDIRNADALRARLKDGLEVTPSDFNPLNWFKKVK